MWRFFNPLQTGIFFYWVTGCDPGETTSHSKIHFIIWGGLLHNNVSDFSPVMEMN